jgi:NADH:ubiquinone oxidoreductase subunit E
MTLAKTPGVEARAGRFGGPSLIPELTAIQERLGWLPREELVALSRDLRRPLYEIEGLVSFYPHFRTEPPAPVEVHGCRDLTCWLAGSEDRLAALRARLEAAPDVEFREVSCLGRCDVAPAVAVNERPARRRLRAGRRRGRTTRTPRGSGATGCCARCSPGSARPTT